MADPARTQSQQAEVNRLRAALQAAQARRSAIYAEQRQVNTELIKIKSQLQDPNVPESTKSALLNRGQQLEQQYNQLEQQGLQANREVEELQAQLSAAEAELERLEQSATSSPTQSSGQTVEEQQRANAQGADPQTPNNASQRTDAQGVIISSTGNVVTTNAFRSGEEEDAGTNAPLRNLANAQSSQVAAPGGINAANTAKGLSSADDAGRVGSGATASTSAPARSPVATSAGDDQTNATRTQINTYFGGPSRLIVPQSNVLDKFASYTYSISIYILNKDQYTQILQTKRVNLISSQLLIQSAGAPTQTAGTVGNTPVTGTNASIPGRNQFFPLDFYIDDLRMKSAISGKGTQGSHNVFEIAFKIIEPNGITLLDNLYSATQQFVAQTTGNTKKQNYAAQLYLMAIRFYGYDAEGRPVSATGQVLGPDGKLSAPAVVEKYIPFVFSEIKFKIANRLTEYDCKGVCPQNFINTGQGRGTIPYNSEIAGSTLKELLVGKSSGDQVPPTVIGLCDALNNYQQQQLQDGQQEYADIYEIQILDKVMQDARTQPPVVPGTPTNYRSTVMTPQTTAAEQKDGKKQNAKSQSKSTKIVAGTSIVRFIDQAIRNSTYIYDQQIKLPSIDPDTGKQYDVPTGGTGAETLAWYRIGTEAEPIGYDSLRNDYAYKIKYQISLYQVNGVISEYFPNSTFNGVHKRYNYWFTGQNNSVINLEQDYNYLYYVVVNGNRKDMNRTSDYREYQRVLAQTRSNQSDQGQPGMVNEPGANASDYLYSPTDLAKISLTIVGDPAWLQQGETAFGFSGSGLYAQPFLPDGTINFERQEVLFEVAYNKPVDYNLQTGLMDPGQNNVNANRAAGEAGQARQSYVYKAIDVTSIFSRGRFTQELNGSLVLFDIRPKTSTDADLQGDENFYGEKVRPSAQPTTVGRTSPVIATGTTPTQNGVNFAPSGGTVGFNTTPLGNVLATQAAPYTQVNPVASLLPQLPSSPPTSGGAVVGPEPGASPTTNFQTGGVNTQPVTATVVLKSGVARTVTSDAEVNQLFVEGLITAQTAGTAIYTLNGKTAAQQSPATTTPPQLTGGRDP